MSRAPDTGAEARRLDALYRAKAIAEIAEADALVKGATEAASSGDEMADVLLVKGEPGPTDREARRVLAGPDGEAAEKALDALGLSRARYAMCSRVGGADEATRARRLRLIVEAVDPRVIVALDARASADLAAAFEIDVPRPGVPVRVLGRDVVAIDGLEASLADERLKRRVWGQLQALRPAPETKNGRP
ncbi:MAG TPA: hypothetical protein VLQ52_01015 [Coriobacteriia bacterium]|nr:hypothetical protein [Coriobacteriia bacterium]